MFRENDKGQFEAVKTTTQWATRAVNGIVFVCRDEPHARGMLQSRSPVLGPWEGREVVRREVTEWKEA